MLATDRKAVRKRAVPSRQPSARILVATAGDADSIGALHVAAELARTRPASVVALGIALPFPHTAPTLIAAKTPASIDEDGRTRVFADMQTTLADVPGADGWAKRAVVGWPADVINSAADVVESVVDRARPRTSWSNRSRVRHRDGCCRDQTRARSRVGCKRHGPRIAHARVRGG
jgi:nucleotide-binding universal stress UspA family protein